MGRKQGSFPGRRRPHSSLPPLLDSKGTLPDKRLKGEGEEERHVLTVLELQLINHRSMSHEDEDLRAWWDFALDSAAWSSQSGSS